MPRKDYRTQLKKAGLCIISIGMIDIAVGIYCIKNEFGYASSLNIFAVIAGLIIFSGNLKAVNFVATCCAIFFCMTTTGILFAPFFLTPGLIFTSFRLEPVLSCALIFITLFYSIGFIWIYQILTSEQINIELKKRAPGSDSFWKKPVRGFLYGTVISVLALFMMVYAKHSDAAKTAEEKAKHDSGTEYKYVVISLRSARSLRTWHAATIVAYNSTEIKKLKYDWWEK